jgi:hypothetical protein
MARKDQRKPISALLLLLSLLTSPLFAKPVTVDQVRKVAGTFLTAENMRAEKQLKTLATKEIQKESPKEFIIAGLKEIRGDKGRLLAYITELEPEGFIITSADTDISPILGYSFKGEFPYEDSKQNVLLHLVQWDVEGRLKALDTGSKQQFTASATSSSELWNQYASANEGLIEDLSSSTQWPAPYWCPTCGHRQPNAGACAQCGTTTQQEDGWITTIWHQDCTFQKIDY